MLHEKAAWRDYPEPYGVYVVARSQNLMFAQYILYMSGGIRQLGDVRVYVMGFAPCMQGAYHMVVCNLEMELSLLGQAMPVQSIFTTGTARIGDQYQLWRI